MKTKKTKKQYTYQSLLQFVWRADTTEKLQIARQWIRDHVESEMDFRNLMSELNTQKMRVNYLNSNATDKDKVIWEWNEPED